MKKLFVNLFFLVNKTNETLFLHAKRQPKFEHKKFVQTWNY